MSLLLISIYKGENRKEYIKYIKTIGGWWNIGLYKLTEEIEWLIIDHSSITNLEEMYKLYSKRGYNRFHIPIIQKIKNLIRNYFKK